MIPGEVRIGGAPVECNAGRARRSMVVVNDGGRPIQIGSHLHLPDANPALSFDRELTQGFRLDIPAGTSVRLEPGVSRTVDIVALGGRGHVPGLQVRGIDSDLPTHRREPKRVVPFGTPGTHVEDPHRAGAVRARVSGEPADRSTAPPGAVEHEPTPEQETP
ncbi:urease subunit beta [Occultella gossypii]|uniref:Urease subunit beta n=1 Tax=Occultella gossypii TaxID=2800820 RepID=A0ABS7SBX2_9MICO|nr:urease subunit beta [Occultella gossypii]MBZ2197854.1 urease subunit beta [Occultella gossypii]